MKDAIEKSLPTVDRIGEMTAVWRERRYAGSCSFCASQSDVYVLTISGNSLTVRLCQSCLENLKQTGARAPAKKPGEKNE